MSRPTCTILIADDDKYVQDDIADLLKPTGHRLLTAGTARETWLKVAEHAPELVLLDIRFPDLHDLSLLKRIKREAPGTEVIIVSSQTENISQIVEAIKLGAYDYIPKPFVPEELRNRVEKALRLHDLSRSQEYLLQELRQRDGIDALVGESPAMRQVRETIRKIADADGCVLIRGESGTGKELAARALHYLSNRRASPFVVVNCAAIPESLVESVLFGHRRGAFTGAVESTKGKFESAECGTVFLDEIGDMAVSQQASLLRVLEYRKFCKVGESEERDCQARFVLATNRDLRESVRTGKFREDLFYRINVACVTMPPLRARPEDVAEIAEYYCRRLSSEMGRSQLRIHADVLALLKEYDWPGNVRELRNILEAAVMLGDMPQDEIVLGDLPPELLAVGTKGSTGRQPGSARQLHEKEDLIRALLQAGGSQTAAAKILGCHRNTIRAKIRYYGIASLQEES